MERVYESRLWKFFRPQQRDGFKDKGEPYGTPSLTLRSRSSGPPSDSASTSSAGSISSSTTFWRSPRQLPWSPKKYLPAAIRFNASKRQIAVLTCLFLAIFIWFAPPPSTWHRSKARYVVKQQPSSPYQVLRPVAITTNKHAPDPEKWLKHHSDNKYAVGPGTGKFSGYGRISTRPRAALITLVRNSELDGILQSMRQLEYHWNRKYQYPWIFFNDEPFSDDFKVPSFGRRG
jgi:alpha 1,2-mannosyltransferase